MSDTPARDALRLNLIGYFVEAQPDLVVAALIESGWRPTDDQLRAMGGDVQPPFRDHGRELAEWQVRVAETPGVLVLFPRSEEATDG